MSLFRLQDVVLHNGGKSEWIIDCNALTDEDLATLAKMATKILPEFGSVEGIPRGGLRFAAALAKYITPGSLRVLIADDVCTTGRSFVEHRSDASAIGIAIFSRGTCPGWVHHLFSTQVPM